MTRIAQPTATARAGSIRRGSELCHRRSGEHRRSDRPGDSVVLDTDDIGDERRRHRGEQPRHGETGECRGGRDHEHRPGLGGIDSRCTPTRPVRGEVSAPPAPRWPATRQHDVHDEGQVQRLRCVLAPTPRPAAGRGPVRRCWRRWRPPQRGHATTGGAASMTAAVAVPVKMPADSPDSTRPISSSRHRVGDQEHHGADQREPAPASSTGRRPTASDHRPNTSSATSTPTA